MSDDKPAGAQANPETPAANPEVPAANPEAAPAPAAAAVEAKPGDKPADPPAADPKPDDKPADPPKPEELKLELPKDSKLAQADVDKIASFAKEQGLSPDAAKALLARESAEAAGRQQAAVEQMKAQSDAWKQEILADPEMGGDNAAKAADFAHSFAKKYWSESFLNELEKTGLGNHPELMRGFYRAGKAMSPDTFKGGGLPPAKPKGSVEDRLYDNTPKT